MGRATNRFLISFVELVEPRVVAIPARFGGILAGGSCVRVCVWVVESLVRFYGGFVEVFFFVLSFFL